MSKVLLIIIDGYGKGPKYKGNAIDLAKKPFIDKIRKNYPTTLLKASGNAVGLPDRYMGNSEVGHFTIGAGRIVYQSLEMISQSIINKSFYRNSALKKAMNYAKKNKSKLHLLGMISNKGVHAHIDHLIELMRMAQKNKLNKVYIHAITDGRDVSERTAKKYITAIQHEIKKLNIGNIATIIGRYYAMDRDQNWKRTQKSYDLLTKGEGFHETDPLTAIDNAYKRGDPTDYYIKPIILNKDGLIQNKDAIIFFNFRTDRAKQLTDAFTEKTFKQFPIKKLKIHFACMGPYSKIADIAFKAPKIKNNLGKILSLNHIRQLRIAETEKYAHVTFFFNSQIKKHYPKEDRILIHSPKVPSYADKPEMSAEEVTSKVIHEIKKEKYQFILLNYANGDLVGHSGNLIATIKCIEFLNKCLEKLVPIAQEHGYEILITSDHGNAEKMINDDGTRCPSHTTNPVECTLISKKYKKPNLKKEKGLQDIAPTVLNLLDIKKPKEMEGKSLIKN